MDSSATINGNAANYLRELARTLAQEKFNVELIGAKKAEALLKKRVFNDGKATSGAKIGSYSTTPGYYGSETFIKKSKFKPGGNPEAKRKKKNPITMYIGSGYSGLRTLNGRQTGYVDLQYSGDLFESIQVSTDAGSPVLKIISSKEADISEGLEERFGKTIFELSGAERTEVKKDMGNQIQKIVDKFVSNRK